MHKHTHTRTPSPPSSVPTLTRGSHTPSRPCWPAATPHRGQVRPPHVHRLKQVAPQAPVRRRKQLRQAGHDALLELVLRQRPPDLQQGAHRAGRGAAKLEGAGEQGQHLAGRDGLGDGGEEGRQALEEGVLLGAVLDCRVVEGKEGGAPRGDASFLG
jgi:hypothetical protein